MATTEDDETGAAAITAEGAGSTPAEGDESAEEKKLHLDVNIDARSACERHVTVSISREDIDRYYNDAYSEMMGKAVVPGFRAGRAPRKLVELRFRKDVGDQIKNTLLMDSLTQLSEEGKFSPISEPDIDPLAISLPDEGPMKFEFNIEVRPEFELPQWKGLKINRPVREFTDKDIERQMKEILARHGRLVPHDGPAEAGDYVTVNLRFKDGENVISEFKEQVLNVRAVLSFRDGKIEGFDKLMQGAAAGERRTGQARLTEDAPNETLRGKMIDAEFEVLEVKKLELPELTPTFLEDMGDFDSEADLRDAIQDMLERRLSYEQHRQAREQILKALTVAANWDLPPAMLKRQSLRELERAVLELRRSGFSDADIRARENELRQNSRASTARALKEHFVLERIAEEEEIDATPGDYDHEIALLAEQSGESTRRMRAQIEKRGLMDTLRNQIIERKVIERIMEHATFKDVPYEVETTTAEAVDEAAGGEVVEIPEAVDAGEPGEAPHRAGQP